MLIQKLVEVFPRMCRRDGALAGSDAATRRITNSRLVHLGRRSTACKLPPGYVGALCFSVHASYILHLAPTLSLQEVVLSWWADLLRRYLCLCVYLLLLHVWLLDSMTCRACPLSYVIKSDETQSIFTGKHQRDGVSTMAFIMAGVWRPKSGNGPHFGPLDETAAGIGPVRDGASGSDTAGENNLHVLAHSSGRPASGDDQPAPVGGGGDESGRQNNATTSAPVIEEANEDAAVNNTVPVLAKEYDWSAYRAVWGDTPVDEAVTGMFAEFAVLHAQLRGSVRSTAPRPLTLEAGRSVADRAERFVLKYVTPILGLQHSTKVHKLMCHVMDAIRMHGNIVNGNAGDNESQHKDDKPYYARTSKDIEDFTRQLVVQAHGARAIQQRITDGDEEAEVLQAEEEDRGDSAGDDDEESDDQGAATRDNPPRACRRPSAHHLPLVQLSHLMLAPGLDGVDVAIGLEPDERARVASRVPFEARFDDGTTQPQLLYGAQSFRGSPWYDSVLYEPSDDSSRVSVGEVRAILRLQEGDVVVIADMEVVEPEPNCPLAARGCTRLAWHVPQGQSDVCLRAVPLQSVRRVLHVVPDFGDLAQRHGFVAEPAALTAPREERLAMRYFMNDFYVWGP